MSIAVAATLAPIEVQPTHVVESSLVSLPHIVERTTECGVVKMHIPLSVPPQINLRVDRIESHGFDVPTSVVAGKTIVMQGVVVRREAEKMLISHGGLMMQINLPGATVFKASDRVRTTITF